MTVARLECRQSDTLKQSVVNYIIDYLNSDIVLNCNRGHIEQVGILSPNGSVQAQHVDKGRRASFGSSVLLGV